MDRRAQLCRRDVTQPLSGSRRNAAPRPLSPLSLAHIFAGPCDAAEAANPLAAMAGWAFCAPPAAAAATLSATWAATLGLRRECISAITMLKRVSAPA